MRAGNSSIHGEVNAAELNTLNYFPLTALCLWDNLPQVLTAAIFFSVACAPSFALFVLGLPWAALLAGLVLIAPAWASLLHYEGYLARGRVRSVTLLLSYFRRCWLDSVRLAALAVAVLAPALWGVSLESRVTGSAALFLAGTAILLGLLIFATVLIYAFPMLAMYNTSVPLALRNSVVLSARHITNTLGLVALAVLMAFALHYVSLGLLFFLPAIYGVFVVNNCLLTIGSPEPLK